MIRSCCVLLPFLSLTLFHPWNAASLTKYVHHYMKRRHGNQDEMAFYWLVVQEEVETTCPPPNYSVSWPVRGSLHSPHQSGDCDRNIFSSDTLGRNNGVGGCGRFHVSPTDGCWLQPSVLSDSWWRRLSFCGDCADLCGRFVSLLFYLLINQRGSEQTAGVTGFDGSAELWLNWAVSRSNRKWCEAFLRAARHKTKWNMWQKIPSLCSGEELFKKHTWKWDGVC